MPRARTWRGLALVAALASGFISAAESAHARSRDVARAGAAPHPSGAACTVTAGSVAKLIRGDVLAPFGLITGGEVLVDVAGEIACVGRNCASRAPNATVINCPQAVISPGLINAHDHLTFTQNPPHPDLGERFEHRHDWRLGLRGHDAIPAPGGADAGQVTWGELRFVLAGATSTAGAGGAPGLLRNLDDASLLEAGTVG